MSDVNFYVFADEIEMNGINLTSQVAMLMILELLVYETLDTGGAAARSGAAEPL